MKVRSFGNSHWLKDILRLSLFLLISCVLALAGATVSPGPVQAGCGWNSTTPVQLNPIACQYYSFSLPGNLHCTSGCSVSSSINGFFFSGPPFVDNVSIHGLYFNSITGEFSGTPTIAGESWTGRIYITSGSSSSTCLPTTSLALTVTITVQPCTLSFVSTMIPAAQENVPYSVALSATGGTGPYTWTASGLPVGLYIDPNSGVISGTPSAGSAGAYSIAVTVTDTTGCCGTHNGSFLLNVVYGTYDFQVKIGPGLTQGNTNVLVDGSEKATLGGGQTETFTAQQGTSHVVAVDQTVASPAQASTKFMVKGANEMTVSESNLFAYFDYAPAVLIGVDTSPPGIAPLSGGSWYAVGDNCKSSAPATIDDANRAGTQYRFSQWRMPDDSTSPNNNLSFTVSAPGTVSAVYDTYYLLTLSSDYPKIADTTWCKSGTNTQYSFSVTEAAMSGLWGFLGGKMKATNPTGTHLMDGPYTEKIVWSYDYTIPIVIIIVAVLVIAGIVYLVLRRRPLASAPAAAGPTAQAAQKPAADTGAETTVMATSTTTTSKKKKTAPKPATEAGFCAKCGAPADKDAEFCKKCGNKLG